jgi:hypothetical protein
MAGHHGLDITLDVRGTERLKQAPIDPNTHRHGVIQG